VNREGSLIMTYNKLSVVNWDRYKGGDIRGVQIV